MRDAAAAREEAARVTAAAAEAGNSHARSLASFVERASAAHAADLSAQAAGFEARIVALQEVLAGAREHATRVEEGAAREAASWRAGGARGAAGLCALSRGG